MQLKMWYRSFKKKYLTFSETHFCLCIFFFLSGFYFKDTEGYRTVGERRGLFFYSTLPLPPTHEQSDIYLQLWISDDYHIFYITPLVFTRLPLDEIYHLIVYLSFFASHLVLVKFQWETYNPSKSYLQAWDAYTASFK